MVYFFNSCFVKWLLMSSDSPLCLWSRANMTLEKRDGVLCLLFLLSTKNTLNFKYSRHPFINFLFSLTNILMTPTQASFTFTSLTSFTWT